jgi:LmbE family N-acetylglucosaminyl deacetylase
LGVALALAGALLGTGGAIVHAADTPAASAPADQTGAAILQNLKSFSQYASVLMIAAHPDDENTQLITYLARGRGYRMAYLSLTRGDGGQNVLGPEFGDELGLIRTEELLAARRLDNGQQFFTRAIDFGFSKRADETLQFWDKDKVLSDVVRVIRIFRPDVVVLRFNPDIPGGVGTHGHHTASAILGREAFKIAGDPKAYPDQLTPAGGGLTPWQPKHLFLNAGGFGRGGGNPQGSLVRIEAGGDDPVLHQAFADIASRSRSMHRSQGFGAFGIGGRGGGPRTEAFSLLGGDPATTDIMDGIDTTWARLGPAGADIAKLTDDAIAHFDSANPAASIPALLAIRAKLTALPSEPVTDDRRAQFDRILADCLGLKVRTTVAHAEVVPGEKIELASTAELSAHVPVKWVATRYPTLGTAARQPWDLEPGKSVTRTDAQTLPNSTPVSQPYWLREPGAAGISTVSDPTLISRPENPPALPIEQTFEIAGQTLTLPDQPIQLNPNSTHAFRRLEVIAPVSLAFPFDVALFAPGQARSVAVEVTSHIANASGTLQLDSSWKVEPASQSIHLAAPGDKQTLTFTITPPTAPASISIAARALVNGLACTTSYTEINFPHIPILLLQPQARLHAVVLDCLTRAKNVAYLPGAGDSIADCLQQLGCTVTELKGDDLTPEKLNPSSFDALVIGVRAFNTRTDLTPAHLQAIFDFADNGGTVIEQYNRPDGLKTNQLAPYNLHLSGLRVTDETAVVTFLVPDHPALNSPNKLTAADFDNWVQERNIYLPDQWDNHFTPILGMADPNETPPNSALLIANHGKGHFVYTSLVFFRELPAGNPGAYRLFANLLSLGKP